ncbi:HAMP domain-containing methyl-accepting chemotaxis protein [Breoghania sp. L-A4]|uniref:methyl-accepting chemotaxis protein n=1 Tax=Breoghania sp. L-A4 TaxID=2304600 RepID=UPI0013C3592A|nr:HAMP domain-containing methyl-accepting chemotaxis protein [Breoghania sp. L-A4]
MFDRLTLRLRVIVLALSAIVGILVTGTLQYVSDAALSHASGQYEKIDKAYETLSVFQRELLRLRVAEQRMRAERKASILPALETARAAAADRAGPAFIHAENNEIADGTAALFDDYLAAITQYVAILDTLGYRDRQSVVVTEAGKDGIDSPTGFTVDLSNAATKISTRLAEELEFDDQAAVFRVDAAFNRIRRDILKLIADADQDYVALIEAKFSEVNELLQDGDLDSGFSDEVTALMTEMHAPLEQLSNAELALADIDRTVNARYETLDSGLTEALATITQRTDAIRTTLNDKRSFLSTLMMTVAGVTLAVLVLAGALIVRSVTRSLSTIIAVTGRLARGETDCDIPYADARTELGDLARALAVFRDNAVERTRLEDRAEVNRAARTRRQETVEQIIGEFNQDIVALLAAGNEAIDGARTSAAELRDAAQRNDAQASSADEASVRASANVQTVAAATEQLNASITEISAQVSRTSDQISQVSETARSTNADVDQLAAAVGKIDEIIALIQAIAEQTNMLALNATIEAARAGEHGRGFSVVASEVKSLANQTASATDEISSQIKAIQSSSQATVSAISGIVTIIGDVQENAASIAAAIEQQNAATGEISRNIAEAADGTRMVAANVSDLRSSTAMATQSAERIRETSENVGSINERIRARIDGFLEKVAAA